MKYQSEIIHEILEQRGHKKSSLHYQSECIEKWIEEAKGAYPKLTDYQAEWLSYINKIEGGGTEQPDPEPEPPIGEFPYVTLTDVTEATVDNVVPYAYKSATLKGNTLVNLVSGVTSNEVGNYNNPCKINVIRNLQNESLTIIFNVTSLEIPDGADGIMRMGGGMSGTIRHKPTVGINKVLYNCTQQSNNWLGVFSNSEAYNLGQRITISNVMVLEGDHTQEDIPYFEGMQSVKNPVLRTTGKNLFDGTWEDGYTLNGTGEIKSTTGKRSLSSFIEVNQSFSIYSSPIVVFRCYGENKNDLNGGINSTRNPSGLLSLKPNTKYIRVVVDTSNIDNKNNFMVVTSEGHLNTYEPFKSNILTVNEDVILRSNGSVYDDLDLLTGKLTQRIGENNEVLAQEVVKTVELSITDENENKINHFVPIEGTMHIQTDGTPIKPSVSMEIPVEAITQNLASFIGEE